MSRVLIVEGERPGGPPSDHTRLVDQLRADGHEVVEVTGRRQLSLRLAALHRADSTRELPDVIITDAEQSGGPTLDLLVEAHRLRGGTPVILLADAADVDLQREAGVLGASYVFFHPCEVDALRRATAALS